MIYFHESWGELWEILQIIHPEITEKIGNKKSPKVHPVIFQTHAPWEILNKINSGYLCLTCVNLEKIRCGKFVASKLLKSTILDIESELESEIEKIDVSEDAVLYNKQLKKSISSTKDTCSILSCYSKFRIIYK